MFRVFLRRDRIGRDGRGDGVRFYQPDFAVFVEADQFEILGLIHLPRPDDVRSVDVRSVIDPFVQRIVIEWVSDDHELSSRHLFQPGFNLSARRSRPAIGTKPFRSPRARPYGKSRVKGYGI